MKPLNGVCHVDHSVMIHLADHFLDTAAAGYIKEGIVFLDRMVKAKMGNIKALRDLLNILWEECTPNDKLCLGMYVEGYDEQAEKLPEFRDRPRMFMCYSKAIDVAIKSAARLNLIPNIFLNLVEIKEAKE